MGGVVDGGVGIGLNTSPRRAAIEKAQAELRYQFLFFFFFLSLCIYSILDSTRAKCIRT